MPAMRFVRADSYGSPEDAGKGAPLPIIAATAGRKADGIDLADLPWDFSRGMEVDGGRFEFPMLWVHDFAGRNLPIGVMRVGVGEDGTSLTESEAVFDPEDEFAVRVERKYRSPVGGLNAFSISWDEVDDGGVVARVSGKKAVANQFLEGSAVPVPMDPDAIQKAERLAMRRLQRDLDALLEEAASSDVVADEQPTLEIEESTQPNTDNGNPTEPGGMPDPYETAAAMVAVFDRGSGDTDAERRRKYDTLLPKYRLLGWEAPEFLSLAVVRALDAETWDGLFLAGETRVGKELSSANVRELSELGAMAEEVAERLRALVGRVNSTESGDSDSERDYLADMLHDLTHELDRHGGAE